MNFYAHLYAVIAFLLLAAAACGWIERQITVHAMAHSGPMRCDPAKPVGKRWH